MVYIITSMQLDYHVLKGEKPSIYLFHTIPLDRMYLYNSLKNIDRKNRIISFSFRGHGVSPDGDDSGYTIRNYVKDVEALRKKLKDEKIIIFAHGIGGMIAQSYTIKHREKVASIILLATGPDSSFRNELAWNIRKSFEPKYKDELDLLKSDMSDNSFNIRFLHSYAMYFREPNLELSKYMIKSAERMGYTAYFKLQKEIEDFNVKSLLRKYKGKSLILTSEYDVWPNKHTWMLEKDLPEADFFHFENFGHFPMLEDAKFFWKQIFTWIEEKW